MFGEVGVRRVRYVEIEVSGRELCVEGAFGS